MMSERGGSSSYEAISPGKSTPVRGASKTRISFGASAPRRAELLVEYLADERMLAQERRPVPEGAEQLDIKTHPATTHIRCSLQAGGKPYGKVELTAQYVDDIAAVGRHFIVIGAMKAGTTTLFRMLENHPSLCRTWTEVPGVSHTKEINYFTRLFRKRHTPVHYDWRFPFDAGTHAWTFDVSPNYAKLRSSRAVPARIASLGAETRLAYILRDPVDRIESHMAHALQHGGDITKTHHCIRVSRYAWHLDWFTKHIPRKKILLIDFEELCRDPAAVNAQVCNFLGIDPVVVRSKVHNRRRVRFRLSKAERVEFAKAVQPDVDRLIEKYGFEPAREWLREPKRPWFRLPLLR